MELDGNRRLTFFMTDIPTAVIREERAPWTDAALADLEWATQSGKAIIIPERHDGHRLDVLYHGLWDAYRRSALVDRYTLRTKRLPQWTEGGAVRPAIQAWLVQGPPATLLHTGLVAAKRLAEAEVQRLRLETASSAQDRPALVRGAEAVVRALDRASRATLKEHGADQRGGD